jgi:hypothetical protein
VALSSLAKRRQALALAGLAAVMLLPLEGLPLAAYVRGMIGDLSITSLLLLGMVAARRCGLMQVDATASPVVWVLLALAACVLYPLALGLTPVDPYRWGYGEPAFLLALLVIAVAGNLVHQPLVASAIALAVLAWTGGWYESSNLWDYLIDPLLSIYALVAYFRRRMT